MVATQRSFWNEYDIGNIPSKSKIVPFTRKLEAFVSHFSENGKKKNGMGFELDHLIQNRLLSSPQLSLCRLNLKD